MRYRFESKNPMLAGIVLVVLGLLMMILRAGSLDIIIIGAGVLCVLAGAYLVYRWHRDRDPVPPFGGAVLSILGIVLIVLAELLTDVLMALLALALILIGVIVFIGSIGRLIPMAVGAVMVVLGIYALLNLRGTADIVMIVIGAVTFVAGLLSLMEAYRVGKTTITVR